MKLLLETQYALGLSRAMGLLCPSRYPVMWGCKCIIASVTGTAWSLLTLVTIVGAAYARLAGHSQWEECGHGSALPYTVAAMCVPCVLGCLYRAPITWSAIPVTSFLLASGVACWGVWLGSFSLCAGDVSVGTTHYLDMTRVMLVWACAHAAAAIMIAATAVGACCCRIRARHAATHERLPN